MDSVPILNTEVEQHWAWIVLGWETLQRNSGTAGTPKGSLSKDRVDSCGVTSPKNIWKEEVITSRGKASHQHMSQHACFYKLVLTLTTNACFEMGTLSIMFYDVL